MNKKQRNAWFLATVTFAVCLTTYTLSDIVIQPWHVLPGLTGDAIKNDFSYLYQSIYGKGFWFDGMNYPYGDNIVYADGQATLSVLLSCFKNITVAEALTLVWWLIGLSYVLSIVYIYKTLIHFKVTPPVAVIFAGLIGIFSPQLLRIGAHYGLSYTCVVPMLFYWTIKYNELDLKKYCVYIFGLGLVMAFFHPYFAALVLVWALCYIAGYFIFTKGKTLLKIKHASPLLVSIFFVFAVIAVVMKITDPVTDRPVTPYGMLVYTTYKRDMVTSIYSPIWQYIHGHHMLGGIVPHISEGGEGYSYIGLVVIAAIIFSLITGMVYVVKKNKAGIIVCKDGFSPIWLFIAFAALLFSMGVPYIWHMEWLLDYVSFVKQFRTLGRFSWIFYYIITVYGVVVIYTLYTRLLVRHRFIAGYTVLLLSMSVWGYEASGYTKYTRNIASEARGNYDMFFSKSEKNWVSYLREKHFTKNDFQAVLMLNFFNIGSDKLWVGETGWSVIFACKAAFQLHLPIIDAYIARSSWSLAEKQVKIVAGPYADKPILRDIKSNKPFLLLYLDWASLDPDQEYLLQASDYIGDYSQCKIYACYPDRLASNDKKNADSINKILPFMSGTDTCIGDKGSWYVNHLDSSHAKYCLFGNGALPAISGEDSNVATIPLKPLKEDRDYEFSCWFLLSREDYRSPFVKLLFLDSTAKLIRSADVYTSQSVDNKDLWFRASGFFKLPANCSYIKCILKKEPDPAKKADGIIFYKVMDEIMLRPADALIISKSADGSVMVNNHLFKKAGK